MTKRRRAPKGEGSVYFDQDAGRWAAVVTITDPDTGRRRRRKMTAPDRQAAHRMRKQMIAERDATGTVSAKNATVADAISDYLAHPPANWKSPTTRRIAGLYASRITAGLGKVLLSKLTPVMVDDFLADEVAGGLSASTIRDELGLLRRAIRRAERNGLVARNAAALADMPAGARRRKSASMTREQVGALLASDLSPWWRAWLSVALMLGLRPGETGALAWDDVDLAAGVLHVRHNLYQTARGLVPGPLKTEQSRRSLELPQAVTDALVAWGAEQAEQRLAAGRHWHDTGLIFTNGWGQAVDRYRVQRQFTRACKAAGVTRPDGLPFQLRECRHTFVSVLSASGVDLEVISDAVGHINSGITRSVYMHQITDKISDAARVWDRISQPGKPS